MKIWGVPEFLEFNQKYRLQEPNQMYGKCVLCQDGKTIEKNQIG